jgi:nitrile hydratase accessory protein
MLSDMSRDLYAKQAVDAALDAVPAGELSPQFTEPWEAQVFAIALALHKRGVFTWQEWATALGREIREAQGRGDPDSGATYYRHWLAAIERLVRQKGITNEQTLLYYREAWHKAADRTPHGEPILLTAEDLA